MVRAASAALKAIVEAQLQHPELQLPIGLSQRLLARTLSYADCVIPTEPTKPVARSVPRKRAQPYIPPAPQQGPKELPAPTQKELKAFERTTDSQWDPEPQDPITDASCCRALLLEIMRRAAYDWVLYRFSSKLQDKKLAEEAYFWLFVEEPTNESYDERESEGKLMTSFISICEAMDLDPDGVREHIKKLTVKSVMSVGRPAERRHHPTEEGGGDEFSVHGSVALDELPNWDPTWG